MGEKSPAKITRIIPKTVRKNPIPKTQNLKTKIARHSGIAMRDLTKNRTPKTKDKHPTPYRRTKILCEFKKNFGEEKTTLEKFGIRIRATTKTCTSNSTYGKRDTKAGWSRNRKEIRTKNSTKRETQTRTYATQTPETT